MNVRTGCCTTGFHISHCAEALKNTIRTSNKNTLLKRAFSKAYELLEKQTTLKERYPNMVFSEEFLGIPTVSTLKDMQLHFIKKK